jgi:hypothetical protein
LLADYLEDVQSEFRSLKRFAEKAMSQISDEDFFATLDPNSNSIGLLVKHISGNLRSRWTDFLTSDGEKPDRKRDTEFERRPEDTRASLLGRWEAGWQLLFDALEHLAPEDLSREVTIRGQPHSVMRAIHRQMTHYAEHIGQIVMLAKHWAGDRWQTLSIPRGQSEQFSRQMTRTAKPEGGPSR